MVTFVESDRTAVQLMQKNLMNCRLLDQADVRVGLTTTFLHRPDWWHGPYDILFADPPYAATDQEELLHAVWQPGLMSDQALVVLEQDSRSKLPDAFGQAQLIRRYLYGDTALFVYGRSDTTTVTS